jgi:tetratricopeptide (TPR) repeat protein
VVVAAAASRLDLLEVDAGRRRTGNRVVFATVAVALAALVVAASLGWRDFANPANEQLPGSTVRLTSTSSNFRWSWWEEAWHAWRDHPVRGTGAASFSLSHRLLRQERAQPATEPHDLPVQVLSETGVVGFALLAAMVVAIVLALRARLREDRDSAVAVLIACVLAYGLHALVDITWDYVAATAAIFVVVGVLIARVGRREANDSIWAIGAAALAATVVLSIATPALAEHRLDLAAAALDSGNLARAAERAREAHSLNPLALEPLLTEAAIQEARGNDGRALALYRQAVDIQPENPEGYVELGTMELRIGEACSAYEHLNRAYTLDRYNPVVARPGGPLDLARAKVNAGACLP